MTETLHEIHLLKPPLKTIVLLKTLCNVFNDVHPHRHVGLAKESIFMTHLPLKVAAIDIYLDRSMIVNKFQICVLCHNLLFVEHHSTCLLPCYEGFHELSFNTSLLLFHVWKCSSLGKKIRFWSIYTWGCFINFNV